MPRTTPLVESRGITHSLNINRVPSSECNSKCLCFFFGSHLGQNGRSTLFHSWKSCPSFRQGHGAGKNRCMDVPLNCKSLLSYRGRKWNVWWPCICTSSMGSCSDDRQGTHDTRVFLLPLQPSRLLMIKQEHHRMVHIRRQAERTLYLQSGQDQRWV